MKIKNRYILIVFLFQTQTGPRLRFINKIVGENYITNLIFRNNANNRIAKLKNK
jgi:hypothetical protein